MSQTATLRALDMTLQQSFLSAGLADQGTVRGIECDLYIDRDAEIFGDDEAAVVGIKSIVTFRLDQVPKAERGDPVVVGSERWQLAELLQQDESLAVWVVVRG